MAKGNSISIVDVWPNGAVEIPSGLAQGEAVSLDGLNWRPGSHGYGAPLFCDGL